MSKTILILHGWESCAKNWNRVKELLEKEGLKVFVPDLPGFGESPPPSQPWAIDDYVEWVRDFCEKQGLSQFFLLGHSFGGRVAIKFAVRYPEKVLGLILCSAAGLKHKRTSFQFLLYFLAKIGNKFSFLPGFNFLQKLFYRFIVRKTDYFQAKGALKETFKRIVVEDLTPYLSQISVPTLIIWGAKDKITPLSDAYLMKKEISNSNIEIILKVGHRVNLEAPEKLSEIIIKFLKNY